MKKIHRVLAMLMATIMALSLITTAFAEPTIGPTKNASLSIYKYDITTANSDGAWDAESYVSAGLRDDAVIDKLSKYAIQGVELSYLRVASISTYSQRESGQYKVGVLYGFADDAVLQAIGLTKADAYKRGNGVFYFTSDKLNKALADALADNATTVKNALEIAVRNGGKAMPETDANGHSKVSGLEQGLYLVVETRVPENVISYSAEYLHVIYTFVFGSVIYNGCAAILNSVGDSKTPLQAVIASSVVNIAFDLFFIIYQ